MAEPSDIDVLIAWLDPYRPVVTEIKWNKGNAFGRAYFTVRGKDRGWVFVDRKDVKRLGSVSAAVVEALKMPF